MQGTVVVLVIGSDDQLTESPVEEDVGVETGVGIVDGGFSKVLRAAFFL